MKQETNDTPFRMLVLADYCCNTGFAQVASNIMQELKKTDRFDADIIGINFTGDPYDLRRFPFNVYTAFSQADNQDVYGREKFLRMLAQGTYDVVFIIQDTFIVETFAQQINEIIAKKSYKPKTVLYYPIDAHPKVSWATDAVYKFDYAVPYTHYARAETLAVAEPPKSCQLWQPIYHGVNLGEFHYIEDREIVSTFREKWFNNGSTDGRFMVMNVNRNQPRKNILASLQALKRLRELGDEDTLLYLHMAYKDVGGDLTEMAAQLGLELGKDYIVPRPQLLAQGIDNQTMGMLYNAADAVISTTLGEGWGLCLDPKTNVFTDKGTKHIEDISVSDKVYTEGGIFENVMGTKSRQYTGKLYHIRTFRCQPIIASEDHRFYVDGKGYVAARDLKLDDRLIFPRHRRTENNSLFDIYDYLKNHLNKRQQLFLNLTDTHINIQSNFKSEERKIKRFIDISNYDVSRLFGLYVAEGCASLHKGQIKLSFHEKEVEYMSFVERVLKEHFCTDLVFSKTRKQGSKACTVNCTSSIVAILFNKLFGEGAAMKKIDFPLLSRLHPEGFLRGLIEGDGHIGKNEIVITTVSKELAYATKLICSQLGVIVSVEPYRVEYKIRISGKTRNRLLRILGEPEKEIKTQYSMESCSVDDINISLPIKEITIQDVTDYRLVDIEVQNTHSFVAEGYLVHNCMTEAFATRTPIAAPDCTSFTEMGADNRAALVPAGDNAGAFTCQGPMDLNRIRPLINVDKMAQAILDIKAGALPDIDGAEAWAKRYSWPNVCKEWIELFVRAGSQAKLATFHEKKAQTPLVAANRAQRRKIKRKK